MSIIGDIEALINREPWQEWALCRQVDNGDVFFPDKGGSTHQAKRICRDCIVRQECLDYAIRKDERLGIWGGLSAGERHRLGRTA